MELYFPIILTILLVFPQMYFAKKGYILHTLLSILFSISILTYIKNYDIATTTANIVAAVKDTEETYEVVTGTSWTSTVSGNQVTLDLSAYIKKSGSYKITVLLVEDNAVECELDTGISHISYVVIVT